MPPVGGQFLLLLQEVAAGTGHLLPVLPPRIQQLAKPGGQYLASTGKEKEEGRQ